MEALRKSREMRQKFSHLVDDADDTVSQSCLAVSECCYWPAWWANIVLLAGVCRCLSSVVVSKAPSTPATMSKQQATLLKLRSTLSKQHSTLVVATKGNNRMSNYSIVKCRSFYKVECCFDIVAKNGNNVKATFDIVERIVQLVEFDNVTGTLLLVWTWLNAAGGPAAGRQARG